MAWFAEVLIKLEEEYDGAGNRKVLETKQSGALEYGGQDFTALDFLLGSNRSLRQSFPATTRRLRSLGLLGPNHLMDDGLDLFLRIRLQDPETDAEVQALLGGASGVSEVQFALRAAPIRLPQGDLQQEQKYLDPSCPDPTVGAGSCSGGVDALYSWKVPGGDGSGVRVCLCETAFCADSSGQPSHPDLPALGLPVALPGGASTASLRHGTMSLGVLAAVGDTDSSGDPVGTTGICHGADEIIFSTTDYGDDLAIDRVIGGSSAPSSFTPLGAGDVLVLDFTFSLLLAGYWPGPSEGPAESSPAILAVIQAAAALDVTVVQAAGNSAGELVSVYESSSAGALKVWEPDESATGYKDSGGIIVGAGVPGTSADRHAYHEYYSGTTHIGSNYGRRVDCQGWGDDVVTTICETSSLSSSDDLTVLHEAGDTSSYVSDYKDTSAATPMIGGVVACLQAAAKAKPAIGVVDPVELRALLRDPAQGSPQRDKTGYAATDYPIGPLPDLFKLLGALGISPDLHCRDDLVDVGFRTMAFVQHSRSPDTILRPAASADPEADFGAAHWMDDSFIRQAIPGSDAFLHVRVRNRGNAPNGGDVRLYRTEPSPFVHPRDYLLIGWADLRETDGGDVAVTKAIRWRHGAVPDPPHYGLVAEVRTERGTASFPGPYASTIDAHRFQKEHNDIAVRNVQVAFAAAGGSGVPFSMNLRGVPGPPVGFTYRIRPHLPAGTKVSVSATGRIFLVAGAAPFPLPGLKPGAPLIITSPGPFDLGPVLLSPTDRIALSADVTVPAGASPGTYTSHVEQLRGSAVYGRITFVLNVT